MRTNVQYTIIILAALLICGVFIAGCTTPSPTTPAVQTTPSVTAQVTAASQTTASPTTIAATGPQQKLLVATTTSLYDTGLLDYLKPKFEAQNNVKLLITSQGTGKAIELAKNGDADVLLVHSPTQELAFMQGGNGLNRRSFASNSFVIVGPKNDPAGIANMTPEAGLTTLYLKGMNNTPNIYFVSRGDASGTHTAEQNVWKSAKYNYTQDITKSGPWYLSAGKGMGETLQMASEKGAYALTDEGTYLAYRNNLNLVPVISKGASLLNIYSVMTVYNTKQPADKIKMANNFINFLISPQTQADIGNYGVEKYGKSLFIPMSVSVPTATAGWVGDYSTPATSIAPATPVASATTAAVGATTTAKPANGIGTNA